MSQEMKSEDSNHTPYIEQHVKGDYEKPSDSSHSKWTRFATQKNLNTVLIFVLLTGGLLYVAVTTVAGRGAIASNEEKHIQLTAALNEQSLTVEANFTRLSNLFQLLGRNHDDLITNISLLDFAKLVEDIQENFTSVFNHIEGIETSLQDHVSTTSTALAVLQQRREELGRNVTRLEDTTESIDSRLRNFAAETERKQMMFTNSLANVSIDLRQLELDTSWNLNLVNLSLRQDIRALSERLTTFRAEAHGLINRSTADLFAHIENEITEVRGHIGTQVSEVRGHVDNQVAEVRGHIDSQVSEVRQYVDSQDSEVRGRISTAVNEVRKHVDSEISGVTENIDARVRGERQYVDTEINRVKTKLSSGALTLQSSTVGLLTIASFLIAFSSS